MTGNGARAPSPVRDTSEVSLRFYGLLIALFLAAHLGQGRAATDAANPSVPPECKEIPGDPDKALIADEKGAPLDGFDPARVCAASAQNPLAKAKDSPSDYCSDIYRKLGEAAKQLKQALAGASAKSQGFKLDCNESPEKCHNFYDQNAQQVKEAVKQETSLQPGLQQMAEYLGKIRDRATDKGTAYHAYVAYATRLADELNKAPNLQQALALPELNGTKASTVGAKNLGDAWRMLAGSPFTPKKVSPDGAIFHELARARIVAERAQKFAACRLADSRKKVASLGSNVKKLAVNSRNSGPAGQMVAGKGTGDKSTITGDPARGASGPTASQGGGGGGDPMGAASKMMQQAAQLAQQMNQKGGGQGGGAASAANPAMTSAASTSATPTTPASTQPTSYSFASAGGPSTPSGTGGSQAATSGSSSQPASDGVVAFNTGTPSPSGSASPAFASRDARSGASGQGSTPASASASGGGSANVSFGAVGGPSMAGADPQQAPASNDTGASVAGGGGVPSFSGGGASGSAADAGSLKALDAQFNAASASSGGKFDLAPLPALPPLDGGPATSATPPANGATAASIAEQIPGLDAAVAGAAAGTVAPVPQADPGQPAPAAQARAGTAARLPARFLPNGSPAFLGSDNVSLFQRIHSTSERAIRRITHPVAAAL